MNTLVDVGFHSRRSHLVTRIQSLGFSHSVTHALILLDLVRLRILAECWAHNSLAAATVAARGSSALLNLGCAKCVCDLVCRDTGGTRVAAT